MAKKCSEERTLAHPSTGAFRANLPVMKRLSLVAAAVVVVVAVTAIAVALIETRSDGGPRGPLGSLTGTPPIGEARSGGLMGTLVYADNAIGSGTVWRANADGTHPVRLTKGPIRVSRRTDASSPLLDRPALQRRRACPAATPRYS